MKTKLTKLVSIFMVLALLLPTAALAQPSPEADVSVPAAPATQLDVYLIRLADPPLAAYKGGIAGLEATNPSITGERKLDANSPESLAYLGYLESVHGGLVSAMENTFNRSVNVVYEYFSANNGMAVELTAQEAKLVEQFPEVVFVQHDYERELHTDAGPAFIGAPGIWDGTTTGGLPGTMGEGIIIGVIDTGINPSNPSFADIGGDGYDHNNPWGSGTYVGVCDPGDPSYDPTFPCNDKLIGAWGYPTVNGGDPRDGDGHGSHTSSTAGGNFVYTATVEAPTIVITRAISGVAPHANIVAYAACCTGSALAAAIDQIVLDGVDVVNYSIGSSAPSSPWLDFDAVGYLNARDAGIFVATSAGNNGPGPNTVGSPADVPWITSVGSSLHDRAFLNVLQNMSGGATTPPADIEGKGLTVGYGPAPIVYAGDFDGIPPGDPDDGQCLTPFPAGTWTSGEIVVCDRGTIARVAKGQNVLAGGAGGLVLANMPANGEGFGTLNGDSHYLPAVHVTRADGDVLRAWLASGSGHMATISGTQYSSAYSDIMSGFSSRGGNRALPDIIVPSVTAPGTDIIAAYGIGDPSPPEWNVVSGTSMASPHVAGAGALMMALHPEWSPAEIQSALMTTAWTDLTKEDGVTPADTFDMGSGRVDLSKAGIAGLVLDETTANYWAANPDTGGDPKTLNLASMGNSDCDDICSWTRTVSSTVSTPITWTAMTDGPAGMVITVDPISFTLGAYASQVLSVEVDVTAMTPGEFAFAELSLVPDDMSVSEAHLPIAVRPRLLPPVIGVEPDSMSTTQDSGVVTTLPLTITNTGEDDLLWNIFDTALPTNAPLVDWFENFDSYATGSQIIGQGGWEGWGGDPNAGAIVTDTVSLSPDNSIDIVGATDLVHQYSGYDTGLWIYTANVYVPSTLVGQSYFILLNTYGVTNNWSTQVRFDSATGEIFNTGASGGSMPYLTDQWVEIRVEIDLGNDTQDFYYNDTLLYSGTWTEEVSGGGALNINAVDLFANGASSVFYDDLSLVEYIPGPCDVVNDLPWLTVSPDSGTTPSMGSSPVDIMFDSTGLGLGLYQGTVCIDSNDPTTPLYAIPITMTVIAEEYGVDLSGDDAMSGLPGDVVTYTLAVTNTGNVPDTFDVVVSSTWKADASVISVTLNAGQMDYFDVAVTVPAGAADGDMDTATVMVTSTTDPMAMDEALLTTTVGASYGVELSGDDAMGAAPGEVVTYTLAVTNTGNVTDTFNVVVSGTWTTTAPISVTLAPGAMTYIDVVVTVPADAAGGDMDTATVTVTSQSDPLASDMAYLTTSVTTFERYLPLIYK